MSLQNPDRTIYDATVNYHNTLVQMRFSVVAIFMTSAAFLVSAHLSDTKWRGNPILLPLLGIFITLMTWAIELRTRALLANLIKNGCDLESIMGHASHVGFFQLMSGQQSIGVKIPFIEKEINNSNPLTRKLFSHGFCLNSIYMAFFIFWINAAYISH